MFGPMVESIVENGWTTKCMEVVYSHGVMVEYTLVNIKMIKSMVKVYLNGNFIIFIVGLMVENMLDIG